MQDRPSGGERFETLLAAAAGAYAETGYHQASVRSIAARAGVATGTYYLYFASKEASCLAVIDRLYAVVIDRVVGARSRGASVLQKLSASVEATLRAFGDHEDFAKVVLIQAPGAHQAFDRRLREIHAELIGLVAQDLREAMDEGAIPPQRERLAARFLVGSLYEVLAGWLRDGEPKRPPAAAPDLLGYTMRGIGAAHRG